ncbi:hypothetical protein AUR04nite_18570 [Glutamicibacter uratoxydans]|uniref:Uncharacterized protein n=1 Tax=Glutamicibacter uratoxydans TaxID=43667 RepID=A0A4Y4DRU2_GLUUR|nr:hypothetical protein [Glutamicibacter uratoxydans]GED06325.1 hypothetical protein AUR04nite_18570 [Glutamicibacter uratoxydans]
MSLFSKKQPAAPHQIHIHFAQPMTVRLRQQHEQEIIEQLLPQFKASGRLTASGTAIDDQEEPVSSDICCEVDCPNLDKLVEGLRASLVANGIARGSWIEVDGQRSGLGTSEYVLLRTRLAEESDSDLEATVLALHRALGDGAIGWHEDVYFRFDGPVFVFNGDSAAAITEALGAELPKHPLMRRAELLTVTTS